MRSRYTEETRKAAIAAYADESVSLPEWARRLGVSQSYISEVGLRAGIPPRKKGARRIGTSAKKTSSSAWRKGHDEQVERAQAEVAKQVAQGRTYVGIRFDRPCRGFTFGEAARQVCQQRGRA
jgi:transposase-like protein